MKVKLAVVTSVHCKAETADLWVMKNSSVDCDLPINKKTTSHILIRFALEILAHKLCSLGECQVGCTLLSE